MSDPKPAPRDRSVTPETVREGVLAERDARADDNNAVDRRLPYQARHVLMTDEFAAMLGADVEWGKPDDQGVYSPVFHRHAVDHEHKVAGRASILVRINADFPADVALHSIVNSIENALIADLDATSVSARAERVDR